MKVVIYVGRKDKQFDQAYMAGQPKSMSKIGDMPLLWHIMKYYSSYGYKDFILVCVGNSYPVKSFFNNYMLHGNDIVINTKTKTITPLNESEVDDWNITIVDAGPAAHTGGAIKKIQPLVGNEPFMFTYGDGISNIDIEKLLSHHVRHNKTITISAISASDKFGVIEFNDNGSVVGFMDNDMESSTVNGGFMVLNPEVFDYIDDDPATSFQKEPIVSAVLEHQVTAYRHHGFWRAIYSYTDLEELNELWDANKAPWKRW